MRQLLLLSIPTAILMAFMVLDAVPPLVWTSTRYAPGYSERQFRKIDIGTPVERIRAMLGEPLAHFTNWSGNESWMYSFPGDWLLFHWNSRSLVTSNGVVVKKWSFINTD